MKEITIYEFQLEEIKDALRIAANIHKSRTNPESCFDRMVVRAEKYAENALEGNIDIEVSWNGK